MRDQKAIFACAQKLFVKKKAMRREQASLSFEEKTDRLVALQRIAYEMAIAAGREPRFKPWKVRIKA